MYPVNPPGSAPYPMNGAPNMMPPYPTNDGGFGAPVVMGSNGPSAPYNPGFASAPPLVGGGYPPQQPTAPAPYPAFQGAGGPPSQPAPMQFAAGIPGAPMQAAGSARAGPTGAAAMPTSRVELTVSAKNLVDRDTFSKSDPVCIMYQKDLRTNQYYEIGRTEQIKNNLNPAWNTKFTMDYRFEERQVLKFAIYDWDSTSHSVEAHDYLGKLECSLGEIVAAPNNKFERNLELPPGYSGKSSQLVVHAQELGSNKEVLYIKMSAKNVDKKDFFGKSDPYVLITKKMDDGSWTNVHKTNVIKNTLNPDWAACTIRLMSLTSGKPERPLRFQVFDWNSSGQSDFIGEFQTTYCDIESNSNMGKPNCGVCGKEVRELLGKRRRASEPTLWRRLSHYLQMLGAEVNPSDFICKQCSSKAYTYCRASGVEILGSKRKPGSSLEDSASGCDDLTSGTVAKRQTRSSVKGQSLPLAERTNIASDPSPISSSVQGSAKMSHVKATSTNSPEVTRAQTMPPTASTSVIRSSALESQQQSSSSSSQQQATTQHEQQEYEFDDAPQVQAQAVYSQSTYSGPAVRQKLKLAHFLTTTTTQSRCVVCQKSEPGNRKMVQQPAMLDIWVTHQIYLPKNSRTCLGHLDGNVFENEAKETIRRRCKYGPLVDAADVEEWWSSLTEAMKKMATCLDFDDRMFPAEAYQDIVGITKENFDDLVTYVELDIHSSKNRSTRNALAIFLAKLRLGVSQTVLARLFGVRSQSVISRVLHSVSASLSKTFVPMNLGLNHLTRETIIQKHSLAFVKKLFDVADENIALILDGTYLYIQQASDHETQQRTYSAHKHRNLLKFMMVTTPDGYIIDAVGPYGADGPCSDANILNGMLNANGSIMSLLVEDDLLILDRGFRDSQLVLKKKDVASVLPDFILPPEKQLSTQQANNSRKVTLVRWPVEGVNGRVKNKADFFDNVIPITYLPVIGDFFKIECAIINKYCPPLLRESAKHSRIVERVKALEDKENVLKSKVKIFELQKNAQWKPSCDADIENFPILTSEDLFEITLGSYQIKNAAKYNLRHISENGLYELLIHKEAPNILRAKIQSRFRRQITHNVWIEYDHTKSGPEQIIGHYCRCQQGARVVGTCSHVTAVLLYLGKERHESHQVARRPPFYTYLLDYANRDAVSGAQAGVNVAVADSSSAAVPEIEPSSQQI